MSAPRRDFAQLRLFVARDEIFVRARKRVAVGLLGCAITVLLFACAGTDSQDAPGAAPPAEATASTSQASGGTTEEITVTGNRRVPQYQNSPSAIVAGNVAGQMPQAGIAGPKAAIATLNEAIEAVAPPTGPPLSRVEPGEEIWVIETAATKEPAANAEDDAPGSGTMLALVAPSDDSQREPIEVPLPLQHTDVHAVVTGYIGSVDVTQQFVNPYDEKIEAVYLFPLPEKAAVSEFVMTIGTRKIRGILREKAEAQRIYEDARAQGYRASLLVQHRPNVFEQKVANIEPGKGIDVNIRYFHTLAYEDGWYSFVFPTVVGPRYNPPGFSDPVDALPRDDFSTRPAGTAVRYLRPSERSAHDLGISVDLDAGVAIEELSASHAITTKRDGETRAHIELASAATIPNRDFVLQFRVAGETLKSNLLTYTDPESKQGYFTLMLYPPADVETLERRPVEMVFVVDTSGSMMGRPLEQARAAIGAALDRLSQDDTFQIMNFSNDVHALAAAPLRATRENLVLGRRYVDRLAAGGGTEMLGGIRAALGFAPDAERQRFVTFLTDGYIGNEVEILGEVHRLIGDARIFSFGVGNSVNRYLLDGLATEGRGAAAYLGLQDSADEIMRFYFERISHPALTDVRIAWNGLAVSDVYPQRLPDLFVGRPVVVTGKFKGTTEHVAVQGRAGSQTMELRIAASGDDAPRQAALKSLWARLRIEDFARRQNWERDANGSLADAIRATALEYGLMSAYTSFVAVDASERTTGERGTTVHQAVPVPQGVRYDTAVTGR